MASKPSRKGRQARNIEVANSVEQPAGQVAPKKCWPDDELEALRKANDRDKAQKLLKAQRRGQDRWVRKSLNERLRMLLCRFNPDEDHPTHDYIHSAHHWMREHMVRLAERVGGGEVGSGPAAITATAAIEMAAARWVMDRAWEMTEKSTGEAVKLMISAQRLADASRQNILAAHEICAREANARPHPQDGLDEIRQRMLTAKGESEDD